MCAGSVDELVRARLLRTEGEGETATVAIVHEKLFEAWPALHEYITANKKALMDRSLLEARARKWVEMGKPWLSGLASRREVKDFRKAGVTTAITKNFLHASISAWWAKIVVSLAGVLVLAVFALAWNAGLTPYHVRLKAASTAGFKIHREPVLIEVRGGEFKMGAGGGLGGNDEQSVHDRKMQNFAIGKYEVTFDEYDRFAVATGRDLPSDQGWGRGSRPVINITWRDAHDYSVWLKEQTRKPYRLLSEAEWEYAARSGGKEETWAGTNSDNDLQAYAWFSANSDSRTHPVGEKKANQFGVHDMSGNVWEWVEDCWHEDYEGAPVDGRAWKEENKGECGWRVLRGGSWRDKPVLLRSSSRNGLNAGTRSDSIGFRLAQDLS